MKIGHGRFYADVPPVKGVYRGPPRRDLEAARDDVAAGPAGQRARLSSDCFDRATLRLSTRPGRVVSLSRTEVGVVPLDRSHHMARGDVRIAVTLACEECKRRNYQTNKSKRNTPDRITLRKYCRWCRTHTSHKETR